jgi:hypothetical protein
MRNNPVGQRYLSRADFKFPSDGGAASLSIQHSSHGQIPKFDDYATDDVIKISGFRIPFRFEH